MTVAGGWPSPLRASMTLGEAVEILTGQSWACACAGCPLRTDSRCYCAHTITHARYMVRAAHIIAKLLTLNGAAAGEALHGWRESETLTEIRDELAASYERFLTTYSPDRGNE